MADKLIRGNSSDGAIRVFSAITTDTVNEGVRIHKAYPTAAAAFGRVLTVSAIMGAGLKGENDSITVQFKGDGPLGTIVAVSGSDAAVRGYIENPMVDIKRKKNGKLDVGGAVGKGYLSVAKDLGLKEPYTGQVPIVTGEIAEDMTYYFARSEQIPTAISLGVLVDKDQTIKAAGGFMIQLMPEAGEDIAAELEERMRTLPPVTEMIDKGMSAEDILFYVTEGYSMIAENKGLVPEYRCKCSRRRMERALISIGKKELGDIINEQGEAEITCQFCDNRYLFNKNDLEKLLKEAK